MYSADGGYGQVTRALLEAGAKTDLVSAQGYTAADLAGISDNTSLQVGLYTNDIKTTICLCFLFKFNNYLLSDQDSSIG